MTQQATNLVDKCLIATPAIRDPIFASSLIYMCEHSEEGSMGLVVNHRTSQVLDDIFDQLDIKCDDDTVKNQPVYIGGPVQLEQGFVLHSTAGKWQNSIEISSGIHLTSSLDILQAIAAHQGPDDYLVILGFSGWASGQLESELHQNSWLTSACNAELLFHRNSEDKWQMAFDTLGFDISMLSPVSGNAEPVKIAIGFDFGSHWIGMAVGQTLTQQASPLDAVRNGDWDAIEKVLSQWQPQVLIVGLPLSMEGGPQEMTASTRRFARRLEGRFGIGSLMQDERLTTREAYQLAIAGKRKKTKMEIDSIAAVLITESWLRDYHSDPQTAGESSQCRD